MAPAIIADGLEEVCMPDVRGKSTLPEEHQNTAFGFDLHGDPWMRTVSLIFVSLFVLWHGNRADGQPPLPKNQPPSGQISNAGSLPFELASVGWLRVYDGISTYGWRQTGKRQWTSQSENLISPAGEQSTLVTVSAFSDYELQFEYTLEPRSTAEVLLGCPPTEPPSEKSAYAIRVANPLTLPTGWTRMTVRCASAGVAVFALNSMHTIVNSSHDVIGNIAVRSLTGGVKFRKMRLRPLSSVLLTGPKSDRDWKPRDSNWKGYDISAAGDIKFSGEPGEIGCAAVSHSLIIQANVKADSPQCRGSFVIRSANVTDPPVEIDIDNRWMGIDRTKPVEFGTGGIVGRTAAREVVSSNHEAFAMTIVYDRVYTAVWINGYLVSYSKNMPSSDNSPAALSIRVKQKDSGLIVQNLRVAAYPSLAPEPGKKP